LRAKTGLGRIAAAPGMSDYQPGPLTRLPQFLEGNGQLPK